MKKVLVTGTFDILHPGHLHFLQQARRYGDRLFVVVARDVTVKKVKGYAPYFSELERVDNVQAKQLADRVLLGNRGDKLRVVEAIKPDVLCLGYDQRAFTHQLEQQLADRRLNTRVVRLESFSAHRYKTARLHHHGLVAIKNIAPSIITEPRYATPHNFTKEKLYFNSIILAHETVAKKLKQAQIILRRQGRGLKVWDCYRPMSVQKKLWAVMPDERYVGKPSTRPVHTRAGGVDCTLVDRHGRELEMPTKYDEFSDRAHRDYPRHSPAARKNMLTLERAMARAGFIPLSTEWWHFSDPQWRDYPSLDLFI